MKPAPFMYVRPRSSQETVATLGELGGECKVLAGGQSLLAMMNLRLAKPAVLVDIGACGLSGVALNEHLEIGAMTTQNAALASEEVRRAAPLLAHALGYVGHHALRNRGTIGGSIAHADPAAELPAVLVALGGEVVALGPHGLRTIRADDFFISSYTTALADDELLVATRTPARPPDAWAFAELARRRGDFPFAGAAAAFELASDGQISDMRLALFGVNERPLRVTAAEDALRGRRLDDPEAVASAASAARNTVDPVGDHHGSKRYRTRMTEVVVRRALSTATVAGVGTV